jgi:hypothetical protein
MAIAAIITITLMKITIIAVPLKEAGNGHARAN